MSARRRPILVLVAVVCTAGAVSLIASVPPAQIQPAVADTAGVRTPLWSARRIPNFLVRTVEAAARARAAETLTEKLTEIVAPEKACVAVDGRGGPMARIGTGLALAPASTLKLMTATAAIALLGPDHRFTTRVLVDAAGNLVVVGGGDPLLATPDHIAFERRGSRFRDTPFTPLATLADAIAAAGVHVVATLVVDDHAHDTLRFLPTWKARYAQEGDIGSLGALTVDGGFAEPTGQPPSPDPAMTAGQGLASLLAARGITVTDGIERGRATSSMHEIAHVDSAPLADIVGEMLTNSDNYAAEELLRDLAVGAAGDAPATTAMATQIVRREMGRLGVPVAGLVLHDGSGLSPDDRVTCATLLRLITLPADSKFAAVDKGLAVAAESGTLADRFGGGPLAGKLRAKTGSIAGVVGLVGVVDGPDDLRFAFLANGDFSEDGGAQLQAEVAAAIGATPDLRAPRNLVPAP